MSEADRCGFTVVDRDGIEQPCDRPASGWRWYQDVEHEDMLDVACLTHENEGGRRLHTAEARIAAAQSALVATGYFTAADVGPDIAPRIFELVAALGAAVTPTPQETCRHGKTEPHDVVVEGFPVPPRYRCPGRPATPEAATEPVDMGGFRPPDPRQPQFVPGGRDGRCTRPQWCVCEPFSRSNCRWLAPPAPSGLQRATEQQEWACIEGCGERPEGVCRNRDRCRCICHAEPVGGSDTPANQPERCEHGQAGPHDYTPSMYCGIVHCPGPVLADQPERCGACGAEHLTAKCEACPTCGAPGDEWCTNADGSRRGSLHAARPVLADQGEKP